MRLARKVCVVTGASSGIGKRIASDLAASGAFVCAVARRAERLEDLLASVGGESAGHSIFSADVTDREQVAALVKHVDATHGRIDVLVNNAGISLGREFLGTDSIEDLEKVMNTNFYGAVYCTAAFLPLLESSRPSTVINVASVAGRFAFGNASSYCASKFALVGWSEAVHYDLEPKGIHVGVVEPGPIPTEGFPQKDLVRHPFLRYALGTDEDVSKAVQSSIRGRRIERVVPRWYYLLQLPRIIFPPLYRAGIRKFASPRAPTEE